MKRKNSLTPDSIELTIDSLSFNGGRGVGRHEGMVVFVPMTAPGDRVRVRLVEKKARYAIGELIEILQPSPHRREAPCPYYSRCGGCVWQHVSYSEQIEQKQKILAASLRPLKKFGEWETLAFLPAPAEFHYRNRIQLHLRGNRFGFFARGTNDLIEIKKCLICEDAINRKLPELRAEEFGSSSRVEVAIAEGDETVLASIERDPEVTLFSQVNRAQNENLKTGVVGAIDFAPEWIMDLYAGAGNLTFPLRRAFPDVALVAVELSRKAVERAGKNFDARIDWHAGDVGAVLRKLQPQAGAGVIVLDPPRAGCSEDVVKEIARHRPKQIVYVSCNPATFARDCAKWLESGRYQLRQVRGFDMFPQTEHVELLAVLCAAT